MRDETKNAAWETTLRTHVVMLLFLMVCVGNILRKFWDYYRNLLTVNERIVSASTTVVSIVQTNTNPTPVSHSEQKKTSAADTIHVELS